MKSMLSIYSGSENTWIRNNLNLQGNDMILETF